MKIILHFVVNVLVVLGLDKLMDNFAINGLQSAVVFILTLTLVNMIIVPIVKILAFPVNFLTFGLFNIIISLGAIWLSDYLVDGVQITGIDSEKIVTYIIMAVVFTISSTLVNNLSE